MTPFSAIVRAEGTRANRRITVPSPIVAQLRATGFRPPGWIRLSVEGSAPVFVVARAPASRSSVVCTLPCWAFPDTVPGTHIVARVEDTMPYRARASTIDGFDWLPLVDAAYLATAQGPQLTLWSRYEEPFVLNRHGGDVLEWLLAVYNDKGSQSVAAADWALASTNPAELVAAADALTSIGIPRDRQYLEVVTMHDDQRFACVGVRIGAIRTRTDTTTLGILHVVRSQPLLRLFKAAIAQKEKGRCVSTATLLSA